MKHLSLKLLCAIAFVLLSQNLCLVSVKAASTGKIVFTSTRDGNREIYVMNSDGSDQVNLTKHDADDLDPAWSPDGKRIVFVSDRDGERDLYLMDADGGNVERVFRIVAHRKQPYWSPDGKKIVYIDPEEDALMVGSIKDRFENRLGWIDRKRGYPAWSPDGTEIAYDWLGTGDIRIINLETDAITKLPPEKGFVMWHPTWSPTENKIAYAGLRLPKNHEGPLRVDDKMTLYVLNRDRATVKEIIKEPIVSHPSWSPKGDEIVYEKRVNNQLQLFKVDLAHKHSQQLTNDGSNYLANWGNHGGLPVEPAVSSLTTTWGEVKRR